MQSLQTTTHQRPSASYTKNPKTRTRRYSGLLASIAASILASACYVVPIQPGQSGPIVLQPNGNSGGYSIGQLQTPAPAVQTPQVVQISARLYPENATAAKYGMASGTIVSHSDGRGVFNFTLNGEAFSGEATRRPSSSSGQANAAGSKGSYMQCNYTMYKPSQGEGKCSLNNAATFTMHIGG